MRITLNGEMKQVAAGLSLAELLDEFDLPKQRVAVELNRSVVRRADWDSTVVSDADRLEVIHFVGGG